MHSGQAFLVARASHCTWGTGSSDSNIFLGPDRIAYIVLISFSSSLARVEAWACYDMVSLRPCGSSQLCASLSLPIESDALWCLQALITTAAKFANAVEIVAKFEAMIKAEDMTAKCE